MNVSSNGHSNAPTGGISFKDPGLEGGLSTSHYGQSKLANILHAKTLNLKYGPESVFNECGQGKIWTASVHPSFVETSVAGPDKV